MTSRSSPEAVQLDPTWKHILESASIEVFSMMAGTNLTLVDSPRNQRRGDQTAMVGMAGALCGMTIINCSFATASRLAALMLGDDAASNPASTNDALGELCNMVAGNFKAKITRLADHCMLSVPTVISGTDYVMQTSEPTDTLEACFSFESGTVWITLMIHP